ncbi:unnamed protein product [Brachionus calyciflorus]|uniref:Uncharacterized protein n=1 Tax=Brachionus calyciflorus TaxID=104777 RepID=A0A814HVP6_9BILA|nr:unnamed protein product [Brachionus calyciflorus]
MSLLNYAIRFSYEEWTEHISKIKQNNERQRLLIDFHDKLSYKLQGIYNIKCWLKNVYNWFNKSIYWTARYNCLSNNCQVKFDCMIKSEPSKHADILVIIRQKGECLHEKIIKKRRINEDEMTKLGLDVMAKGVSNIYDENLIFNFENNCSEDFFEAKTTNQNVLKMIRSKVKKENQISNDYSIDSRAALSICKSICIQTNNLSGYIQEISEYPYGLMLLNEIQFETEIQKDSIANIEKNVRTRNYDQDKLEKEIDSDNNESKIRNEIIEALNRENFIESNEKKIKNSSHFESYFKILLKKFSQVIDEETNIDCFRANKFYCPDLFSIIENYLYILPLWSGILINEQKLQVTRLSNNPVENWFNHLKNNMLKGERVMPSSLVALVYKKLLSKYILYYNDNDLILAQPKKSKLNIDEEKWKKDEKKSKKQKGFYFQKIKDFGKDNSLRKNEMNDSRVLTALNECFDFRNEICNELLVISKPNFLSQKYPILLIVNNQINDLNPNEIPLILNLDEETYNLIGMTLHNENHFIMKLFDGKNFFDIDNLDPQTSAKNNSNLIGDKQFLITNIFYEKIF